MEIVNSYYLLPRNKEGGNNIATELSKFFFPNKFEGEALIIELLQDGVYIPFTWSYKNISYDGEYLLAYKNIHQTLNDGLYFEVKLYYTNKANGMSALSNILNELRINFSKAYYLVALEDSVSKYYNQLSYKYTSEYERKIRKLILVILVPEFKSEWPGYLTEHKDKLKGNKAVESGLEELDLSHLENILFNKTTDLDIDNYDEVFQTDNLDKLSAEDIKSLIRNNTPQSFWEKYLNQHVKNVDLSERMKNIRDERNKVAHHKYFTETKHMKLRKDVSYVNRKLDDAIELVMSADSRLDYKAMSESISISLEKMAISLSKISKTLYSETFKITFDNISSVLNSDAIKKVIDLQNGFSKAIKNSSSLEYYDEE